MLVLARMGEGVKEPSVDPAKNSTSKKQSKSPNQGRVPWVKDPGGQADEDTGWFRWGINE